MIRSRAPRVNKMISIQKITIINSKNVTLNPKQTNGTCRRGVKNKSADITNNTKYRNKSTNKKNTIVSVQSKDHFDLEEHISKAKQRQLIIIKNNVALNKYYNALITLFMISYTSSQIIISNIFTINSPNVSLPQLPNQFGINFVGLLLKIYNNIKGMQYEAKLRKLACNLLKISPTPSQFQRKVEFISRKVVLNTEKSKQISLSFMNEQVSNFWTTLKNKIIVRSQIQFIEDMFELQPEKLCLKNFQMLVQYYLCRQQCQRDVRQHEQMRRADDPAHPFGIEFLIIEKLCTEQYEEQYNIEQKKISSRCQIY